MCSTDLQNLHLNSCSCAKRYPCTVCETILESRSLDARDPTACTCTACQPTDSKQAGAVEPISALCVKEVVAQLHKKGKLEAELLDKIKEQSKETRRALLNHSVATGVLSDATLPLLWDEDSTVLDLRWCPMVLGDGLKAIAEKCKNLEVLNLAGCKKLQGAAIQKVSEYAKNITHLTLDGCAWHLSEANIDAISENCTNISVLNLSRCMKLTDGPLAKFKNIERAYLLDCVQVTDVGVSALVSASPGLQVLDLYGCVRVSDDSVRVVAKNCPLLRTLTLGRCKLVTDASIVELASSCRTLRELTLAWCREITDKSVTAAAQNCAALQSLSLVGCDKVSDAGLLQLSKHGGRLQQLNVAWCSKITMESLKTVKSSCRYFNSLIYYRTLGHLQRTPISK
eukprot:TRINITY_DN4821_c0_g1_i2.p1 TRINITY_DN4821_c0_g1~~TRINITY_DN4821_c0_g1_i2.p1  ORF type:complete len:398 (+),score=47.94 TRINITY_DN4821_c0_g1_i2:239-1432(+)